VSGHEVRAIPPRLGREARPPQRLELLFDAADAKA